jgi:hypothetical protein
LKHLLSALFYGSPILIVPLLALWAFAIPKFATESGAAIEPVPSGGDALPSRTRRLLVSDLDALVAIQKAVRGIPQPRSTPGLAGLGETDAALLSPLNGWEKIDRPALRNSATLDYFLGFGF